MREKEEIWLSPMTEALTPTEKSKKQRDNTKNVTKNFYYTTIADRLRTVSWGNDSHPMSQKCRKRLKPWDGVINPQNYNFYQF